MTLSLRRLCADPLGRLPCEMDSMLLDGRPRCYGPPSGLLIPPSFSPLSLGPLAPSDATHLGADYTTQLHELHPRVPRSRVRVDGGVFLNPHSVLDFFFLHALFPRSTDERLCLRMSLGGSFCLSFLVVSFLLNPEKFAPLFFPSSATEVSRVSSAGQWMRVTALPHSFGVGSSSLVPAFVRSARGALCRDRCALYTPDQGVLRLHPPFRPASSLVKKKILPSCSCLHAAPNSRGRRVSFAFLSGGRFPLADDLVAFFASIFPFERLGFARTLFFTRASFHHLLQDGGRCGALLWA